RRESLGPATTVRKAPEGRQAIARGASPWDGQPPCVKPRRGESATFAPPGLFGYGPRSRGSRPWLLPIAPSGAGNYAAVRRRACRTLSVNVCVASGAMPLETSIVKVNDSPSAEANAGGVPDIRPVAALMVNQAGAPISVYVVGVGVPLATTWK